jgi:hypothetical protein
MTDPIDDPKRRALIPPASAQVDDRNTRARHAIESLSFAIDAMKIAIEATSDVPRRVSYEDPTPAQTLERWQAANLLMGQIFEHLYFEARHTIGVIKPMLMLD